LRYVDPTGYDYCSLDQEPSEGSPTTQDACSDAGGTWVVEEELQPAATVTDTAPTVTPSPSVIPTGLDYSALLRTLFPNGILSTYRADLLRRLNETPVYTGPVFAAPRSQFANVKIAAPEPRRYLPCIPAALAPHAFNQMLYAFANGGRVGNEVEPEPVHEEGPTPVPFIPRPLPSGPESEPAAEELPYPAGGALGIQSAVNSWADRPLCR